MMTRGLLAAVALSSIAGCYNRAEFVLPMDLVRRELQCPEGPVQLREIDARTRGASGCERRAAFVLSCDYTPSLGIRGVTTQCDWERDPAPPAIGVGGPTLVPGLVIVGGAH